MSNQIRRIAVIGGSRIPFCRSNSIYSEKTNLDMLAADLADEVAQDAEGRDDVDGLCACGRRKQERQEGKNKGSECG